MISWSRTNDHLTRIGREDTACGRTSYPTFKIDYYVTLITRGQMLLSSKMLGRFSSIETFFPVCYSTKPLLILAFHSNSWGRLQSPFLKNNIAVKKGILKTM